MLTSLVVQLSPPRPRAPLFPRYDRPRPRPAIPGDQERGDHVARSAPVGCWHITPIQPSSGSSPRSKRSRRSWAQVGTIDRTRCCRRTRRGGNRVVTGGFWWTARGSNPRPRRCERRALPAELAAHDCPTTAIMRGSNETPPRCEDRAGDSLYHARPDTATRTHAHETSPGCFMHISFQLSALGGSTRWRSLSARRC